jgi:hypothetical protein
MTVCFNIPLPSITFPTLNLPLFNVNIYYPTLPVPLPCCSFTITGFNMPIQIGTAITAIEATTGLKGVNTQITLINAAIQTYVAAVQNLVVIPACPLNGQTVPLQGNTT